MSTDYRNQITDTGGVMMWDCKVGQRYQSKLTFFVNFFLTSTWIFYCENIRVHQALIVRFFWDNQTTWPVLPSQTQHGKEHGMNSLSPFQQYSFPGYANIFSKVLNLTETHPLHVTTCVQSVFPTCISCGYQRTIAYNYSKHPRK